MAARSAYPSYLLCYVVRGTDAVERSEVFPLSSNFRVASVSQSPTLGPIRRREQILNGQLGRCGFCPGPSFILGDRITNRRTRKGFAIVFAKTIHSFIQRRDSVGYSVAAITPTYTMGTPLVLEQHRHVQKRLGVGFAEISLAFCKSKLHLQRKPFL